MIRFIVRTYHKIHKPAHIYHEVLLFVSIGSGTWEIINLVKEHI